MESQFPHNSSEQALITPDEQQPSLQACSSLLDERSDKEGELAGKAHSKRWSDAGRKVTTLLSLSRGFKTLRDQYAENEIQPEELQTIKSLGEGAFAKVDLCQYTPHNKHSTEPGPARIVAVKSVKPEVIGSSQDELNAFLTEVALLRKLKHKHIVAYVGMGSHTKDNHSMFLVEEALPGGSAKRLVIRQMRQLGTRMYNYTDALRWCQQVAEGMAYLHSCQPQVIHRDLKLENILLKGDTASTSTAKIADFGLSALVKKRLLGEIVRANRCFVEASSMAEPTTKASGSKLRVSNTGQNTPRRRAAQNRRRGTKHGSGANAVANDPMVLQAKWNANFSALSRKVLAAEQESSIVQRVSPRLSSIFNVNLQAYQGATNQPWHGGHPSIQSGRLSSTGGSNAGSHFGEGGAGVNMVSSLGSCRGREMQTSTAQGSVGQITQFGDLKMSDNPSPHNLGGANRANVSPSRGALSGLCPIQEASLPIPSLQNLHNTPPNAHPSQPSVSQQVQQLQQQVHVKQQKDSEHNQGQQQQQQQQQQQPEECPSHQHHHHHHHQQQQQQQQANEKISGQSKPGPVEAIKQRELPTRSPSDLRVRMNSSFSLASQGEAELEVLHRQSFANTNVPGAVTSPFNSQACATFQAASATGTTHLETLEAGCNPQGSPLDIPQIRQASIRHSFEKLSSTSVLAAAAAAANNNCGAATDTVSSNSANNTINSTTCNANSRLGSGTLPSTGLPAITPRMSQRDHSLTTICDEAALPNNIARGGRNIHTPGTLSLGSFEATLSGAGSGTAPDQGATLYPPPLPFHKLQAPAAVPDPDPRGGASDKINPAALLQGFQAPGHSQESDASHGSLQPQSSSHGSGAKQGQHLDGRSKGPGAKDDVHPHLKDKGGGRSYRERGDQSGKEARKSEGGNKHSLKATGVSGKVEKKRQRLRTELRQVVDEHVQLSGRTGTLIYMSPEVYKSEHYDEKSDVFSFGVILFELFHRFLVVYGVAPSGNQSEVEQYASQVSQGYRPPISTHIPYSLASLIRDCGAQNPEARPTMAVVLQRLQAIEIEGRVAKMDEPPVVFEDEGCCCSVM